MKVIPRSEHRISRRHISKNALNVLYKLHNAGYQAYLVGGAVRDLLLGLSPKDFDVVTDAHPEQIRELFRNSRLIGRRFRLAHIYFGRDIIEVATFRAAQHEHDQEQSKEGMLLHDNVYGTMDEDVYRRDFTINALYYNIADFSIVDYTGGVRDIENRRIRLIGDALKRYREDPVRMLRALRFSAKLDFGLCPETTEPIEKLKPLIEAVPKARLFDESLKLLMTGQSVKSVKLLQEYGLFGMLFPLTNEDIDSDRNFAQMLNIALGNTDQRIAIGKPVTPAFLFAVMLWHRVHRLARSMIAKTNESEMSAYHLAASQVIGEQGHTLPIPKRFTLMMRDIWVLQSRFKYRFGKRPHRLLAHPRFRAAYDYLLIRTQTGDEDQMLANWWTEFQELSRKKRSDITRVHKRRSRSPHKRHSTHG